ncbi:MAG: RNA polymerase sigma factor [Planctomycetes bacterium]|nr:RNA polymerase sigma factor [Planctomycetota bacterium]
MPERPDLTQLLAESRWLAALASPPGRRRRGGDLAQDTLAAALAHPPQGDRPLRGWLATVLRGRWSGQAARAGCAQCTRPQNSRQEALPPTDDVVAKAEQQRLLVAAVLALTEPERTTVLLRFFEGLPPRAIARRMQASVPTVNSRLQRALAKLRESLDRTQGRSNWLAALVPLARAPSPLVPWTVGVSIVNGTLKIGLCAAALALVCYWLWPRTELLQPEQARASALAAPLNEPASATELQLQLQPTLETGVANARSVGTPTAPPASVAVRVEPSPLRGRVLDLAGRGVANVRLGWEANEIAHEFGQSSGRALPTRTARQRELDRLGRRALVDGALRLGAHRARERGVPAGRAAPGPRRPRRRRDRRSARGRRDRPARRAAPRCGARDPARLLAASRMAHAQRCRRAVEPRGRAARRARDAAALPFGVRDARRNTARGAGGLAALRARAAAHDRRPPARRGARLRGRERRGRARQRRRGGRADGRARRVRARDRGQAAPAAHRGARRGLPTCALRARVRVGQAALALEGRPAPGSCVARDRRPRARCGSRAARVCACGSSIHCAWARPTARRRSPNRSSPAARHASGTTRRAPRTARSRSPACAIVPMRSPRSTRARSRVSTPRTSRPAAGMSSSCFQAICANTSVDASSPATVPASPESRSSSSGPCWR